MFWVLVRKCRRNVILRFLYKHVQLLAPSQRILPVKNESFAVSGKHPTNSINRVHPALASTSTINSAAACSNHAPATRQLKQQPPFCSSNKPAFTTTTALFQRETCVNNSHSSVKPTRLLVTATKAILRPTALI